MGKVKGILSGLFFLLIISAGCKKAADQPAEILKSQDNLNVQYGTHPRNTLDIYLPAKRSKNTPVILLIHGGSWFEGDRSAFTDLAKYWRDKGYAAATMNYRFTNTPENNIHPAQVNDIAKAIEFIALKSGEWKISPDKFALQGASAGAHLSLLFAYKFDTGNKVKAVISMAGPTDLSVLGNAGPAQTIVMQWLIGVPYQASPSLYRAASPITYVAADSKPTLLFHGKKDVVVPFEQSVALKDRLSQSGAVSKLVLYEETGHEVVNLNNMASFLNECESWFRVYLK